MIVSFLFCTLVCSSQEYISAMFYNCENAFDNEHDEGKDDVSFLPDGDHHWSRYRLFNKLKGIAKVIAAVDEFQPVSLVGLCEVENDSVLTFLTERTMLHRMGYKYVMTNSADERGVDVALLYSPFIFNIIEPPVSLRAKDLYKPTRDVLRVCGKVVTGDTLFVYVCHLPSKLGGLEGEESSKKVADMIRCDVDSIITVHTNPYIIVMGDFNADSSSPLIRNLKPLGFSDLMEQRKGGTYKYHGEWSVIDHVLVSSPFFDTRSSLQTSYDSSGIFSAPYLLEDDKTYGGKKPKRTFLWTKYNKGISDHLPIWMKMNIHKK